MTDLFYLNRVSEKHFIGNGEAKIFNGQSQNEGHKRLAIPILNGHEIIEIKNIIRCEADGNYTAIFCIENKKYVISRHLKKIETVLSTEGFLRIHHSHIINPLFIEKILKSDGGSIVLSDGTKIRISRDKHKILKSLFSKIKKL